MSKNNYALSCPIPVILSKGDKLWGNEGICHDNHHGHINEDEFPHIMVELKLRSHLLLGTSYKIQTQIEIA